MADDKSECSLSILSWDVRVRAFGANHGWSSKAVLARVMIPYLSKYIPEHPTFVVETRGAFQMAQFQGCD